MPTKFYTVVCGRCDEIFQGTKSADQVRQVVDDHIDLSHPGYAPAMWGDNEVATVEVSVA